MKNKEYNKQENCDPCDARFQNQIDNLVNNGEDRSERDHSRRQDELNNAFNTSDYDSSDYDSSDFDATEIDIIITPADDTDSCGCGC